MKDLWKKAVLFCLFLFIILELFFLSPQRVDQKDSFVGSLEEGDFDQVLHNLKLVESQGSQKLWELEAEKGFKNRGKETWYLRKIHGGVLTKYGSMYRFVGKKGLVKDDQRVLKIFGDVEVYSPNGYIINTEIILYNTETGIIVGSKPARLRGTGKERSFNIKAQRFEIHFDRDEIDLTGPVYGEKLLTDRRRMEIQSSWAKVSIGSSRVLFGEPVDITVNSIKIKGSRAWFIYKKEKLHSLLLEGDVGIQSRDRWGSSGRGQVFFKEDKYILSQKPKLWQQGRRILGRRIVFLNGGKKVQVSKARGKYKNIK